MYPICMKHILITIAAVLVVGCGESKHSTPTTEAKPVEPVAEVPSKPSSSKIKKRPNNQYLKENGQFYNLSLAVRTGDIEYVKQALIKGENANAKNHRETILHCAARTHQTEIAELLISKGADVNAADGTINGDTPLFYSITNIYFKRSKRKGLSEMTKLLIKRGAEINYENLRKKTPLFKAIYGNNKEAAELLIANGAEVNKQYKYLTTNHTLLDIAKRLKNLDCVDLLRKHGAKTTEELKAEGK